jgi:hypothetical protein
MISPYEKKKKKRSCSTFVVLPGAVLSPPPGETALVYLRNKHQTSQVSHPSPDFYFFSAKESGKNII